MNKAIADFLTRNEGLTLERRLERLATSRFRNIHLFDEQFKTFLWQEAVKNTGRLIAPPKQEDGFDDYSIRLLRYPQTSETCVDFKSEIGVGDVVSALKGVRKRIERRHWRDDDEVEHPIYIFELGDVALVTKIEPRSHWEEEKEYILINPHGEQFVTYTDGIHKEFVKIVPNPTLNERIGAGDKVQVVKSRSTRPKSQKYSMEESPEINLDLGTDEDAFDDETIGMTNGERKTYSGRKQSTQIPPNQTRREQEVVRENLHVLKGQEYFVAEAYGKDLYLATDKGQIFIPSENVVKVQSQSQLPIVEDKSINDIVKNTVFRFYERKGIIKKCGMIRQIISHHINSDKEKQIKTDLDNMGIDYDKFLKCCEVLSYVTRTRG